MFGFPTCEFSRLHDVRIWRRWFVFSGDSRSHGGESFLPKLNGVSLTGIRYMWNRKWCLCFIEDETQLLWEITKRRVVLDVRQILCMVCFLSSFIVSLNSIYVSPYILQDMVIDYASGILRKALDVATLRSRSAVKASVSDADILTVVKQDPKKYDRLLELQRLKEELENTRQIDGTGDTQRELVVTKDQARALGAK